MLRTIAAIAADHIDLVSAHSFEDTARTLSAQLERSGMQELIDRLAGAADREDCAAQRSALNGPGRLIHLGDFDWGRLLTLSGLPMKARCFLVGNAMTAQKLLAAGGPALGLYLPTKMLVYEAGDGTVHVAYDQLPLMAPSENDALSIVASAIDTALDDLARAAAGF